MQVAPGQNAPEFYSIIFKFNRIIKKIILLSILYLKKSVYVLKDIENKHDNRGFLIKSDSSHGRSN